jgi:hypothetical protein
MLDIAHYKKLNYTQLQGKLPFQRCLPGIPVINQTHPIQTSNLISLIQTFVLPSKQYVAAAQSVQ